MKVFDEEVRETGGKEINMKKWIIGLVVTLATMSTWAQYWEVYEGIAHSRFLDENAKGIPVISQSPQPVLVVVDWYVPESNAVVVVMGKKEFDQMPATMTYDYREVSYRETPTNKYGILSYSGKDIVFMTITTESEAVSLLGTDVYSGKYDTNTDEDIAATCVMLMKGVGADVVEGWEYNTDTFRYNRKLTDAMQAATNRTDAAAIINAYVKKKIRTTNDVAVVFPGI